jgi:hypothetical protein
MTIVCVQARFNDMEYDGSEKLTARVFISITDAHGKGTSCTARKVQHT